MKTTPLALTLLAATIGMGAFTGTASAGSTLPDNMVEGGTYTIQVDEGVNLADHQTDNLAWIEGEVQPLGAAYYSAGGTLTFTILPHDDCSNHQLDLITGRPLPVVDATHRYNEFPIGGNTSRLIDAVYVPAADGCGDIPTTTTTAEVLPPASTPPTTITVEWADPIPPALTTTAVVQVDVPLTLEPPTITEFAAPVAPPTLPVTGGNTGLIIGIGALNAAFGALFIWGQKRLLRRKS